MDSLLYLSLTKAYHAQKNRLRPGLPAIGLQSQWQTFFTGLVVIGAVLLDQARIRAASRIRKN